MSAIQNDRIASHEKFIVKVQLPLSGANLALIYDEDKQLKMHIPISEQIEKAMGARKKAFFFVTINRHELHLLEEAPWQDW